MSASAFFWLAPAALIVIALSICKTSYADTPYQEVISLSCADGDFIIDARTYRKPGAGYSSVAVRYRYLGIELEAALTDDYHGHLLPYLGKQAAHIKSLLDKSEAKHWQTGNYPWRGEILFLPPAQFSEQQVYNLANCIHNYQQELSLAFINAEVKGRFSVISGLEKGIPLDGIAFLAHTEFPLTDSYANGWQTLLIEHSGRALLYNHYMGMDEPPEVILLGQVQSAEKPQSKPKLLLQDNKAGDLIKSSRGLINKYGELFSANYDILRQ